MFAKHAFAQTLDCKIAINPPHMHSKHASYTDKCRNEVCQSPETVEGGSGLIPRLHPFREGQGESR